MKYIYILIPLFIIIANLVVGFIYPSYLWWHFGMSSGAVVIGSLLMWCVDYAELKDGFKISLFCIVPFFTLAEFVVAVISKPQLEGNFLMLILVALLLVQIALLVSCMVISNTSKNND